MATPSMIHKVPTNMDAKWKACEEEMNPLKPLKSLQQAITNTVIVFDYDDTLFPSSKLKEIMSRPNRGPYQDRHQELCSKISDQELNELAHLSWITFNLLTTYIFHYSMSNIYIVTAASSGWIQKSLLSVYKIGYYSQIYHLLFSTANPSNNPNNKIQIFCPSADVIKSFKNKKQYATISEYPAFKWKYKVFKLIFDKKNIDIDNVINSFTSIGDSEWEYQASRKLQHEVRQNKNTFIHRIKLLHEPSFISLRNEQVLIYNSCGTFEIHSIIYKKALNINYLNEKQRLNQ